MTAGPDSRTPIPVSDPVVGVELSVQRAELPHDAINPSHYRLANGLEAIDVMEAFNLHRDGRLFNAAKYVLRAGKKDKESQDVRKAIWYLQRYADALEAEGR